MTTDKVYPIWILRENGEWLRYAFWTGAVAIALLTMTALDASVPDPGRIVGGAMGVLLFAFSGFALNTRRIGVEPLSREVIIATKGFTRTTIEDSIGYLARNGKKVAAITLAARSLDMTTDQAKDFVDRHTDSTGPRGTT